MEAKVFEGKNEEEVISSALKELNITENDCYIKVSKSKSGLLKKETVSVSIYLISDLVDYIKDYLKNIVTSMGLEVNFETKVRDKQITVKMYSNNNSILIGHDGKTLSALLTVVKQYVYNKIGEYPYLLLDVENYKEKQEHRLERLAKNIAKDVERTKVAVEMECMNSYSRRIIHNALANNPHVYTESTGEGSSRHVVVKPKED